MPASTMQLGGYQPGGYQPPAAVQSQAQAQPAMGGGAAPVAVAAQPQPAAVRTADALPAVQKQKKRKLLERQNQPDKVLVRCFWSCRRSSMGPLAGHTYFERSALLRACTHVR